MSEQTQQEPPAGTSAAARKRSFQFPTAVTVLTLVTLLVWVAALFIPAGQYERDENGAPVAGTYEQIDAPLSFGSGSPS